MSKIAVVTDSTAYLPKEIIEKYNINVVPLSVNFANKTFKEGFDISTKDFYEKVVGMEELPTTSQPAIGEFLYLYEKLAKNHSEAIAIHLSSGISGTLNTSRTAANMVDEINVEVIDSKIACYGLGFMVIETAKLAEEGKSVAEIKERMDYLVENMRGFFVVDDLAYLHKGGRLNAAQYLVGSMLKIKPIIYFNDKVLEPFEKVRTKKKALERILQLLHEDAKSGAPIMLSVVQANVEEEAKELLEWIQKEYSNVEGNISDFGPVIGTHTGPGTLGMVWYVK